MFYALDGAILWRAVGLLDPEHISPDDLTARFRANGVLPTGRVTAVHPGERRPTIISMIIPLRLEYSADAPPDAPTRTILKTDRAGLDPSLPGIGEREVMFYRRAAPVMPGALLARCFDAEYSDGRFHILLEDLSETHTILTQWPLPPSDEACAQIISSAARPRYRHVLRRCGDRQDGSRPARPLRAVRGCARRPPLAARATDLRARVRELRAAVHAGPHLFDVHARPR